ncbi:hypothetical protein ACS0TY_018667 [Phlomoides rotata]
MTISGRNGTTTSGRTTTTTSGRTTPMKFPTPTEEDNVEREIAERQRERWLQCMYQGLIAHYVCTYEVKIAH